MARRKSRKVARIDKMIKDTFSLVKGDGRRLELRAQLERVCEAHKINHERFLRADRWAAPKYPAETVEQILWQLWCLGWKMEEFCRLMRRSEEVISRHVEGGRAQANRYASDPVFRIQRQGLVTKDEAIILQRFVDAYGAYRAAQGVPGPRQKGTGIEWTEEAREAAVRRYMVMHYAVKQQCGEVALMDCQLFADNYGYRSADNLRAAALAIDPQAMADAA